MGYDVESAAAILERTPAILSAWLRGLDERWTSCNEGPDTWSAFDVVGHLIHGERTDWIPRARLILEGDGVFEPFDRFAQREASRGKHQDELLDELARLRRASVATLRGWRLTALDLERPGLHPALGRVTLGQHLATWVAHDLDHLSQIARVMARRYTAEVGPWRAYLRILG